jgi:hypothetical protein
MQDSLFQQEELNFTPLAGDFDVDQIAGKISEIGFSFRDQDRPEFFVICAQEETRDLFQEARLQDPDSGFPMVLLITVEPRLVSVTLTAGGEYIDLARPFVEWLTQTYACKVTNDFEVDLTAELVG